LKYRRWLTFDWSLYIIPILLVATGIATIYTVSFVSKGSSLAVSQFTNAILGIIAMLVLTFVDYRIYKGLVIPIYIVGIILLAILVIPPLNQLPFVIKTMGAARWINLGFFQLQPSEFFKPILILALGAYLSNIRSEIKVKHVIFAIILTALPVLMTLKQPDLGTSLVLIVILGAMLIMAGLPRIYYWVLASLSSLMVPIGWLTLRDYQKARLVTFLNPSHDPLGAGYNVMQSMIAVGSGGLTGRGFGQGSQSQLNFLPVAHTDFIFAGFAEATGFVGTFLLILFLGVLFYRVIAIGKVAKDDFGMFIASGVAAMMIFQIFVNIGMNIALMPVTGIPLPFVSYGGTALIILFSLMGILQSIYLRHKKITF
jgi:rod shape determining protein RodA